MGKSVERRLIAQEACKYVGLTVLMGSLLFNCSLHRKEFSKNCKMCPKFEPRAKRIL